MSRLAIKILYGFAVTASAAGNTPVTRIASPAYSANNAAPSDQIDGAAGSNYGSYDVGNYQNGGNVAADIAASGQPVHIWRETITRHIPEKNTWEVEVMTQTDYQADIDYEPEDWEDRIKGNLPPRPTGDVDEEPDSYNNRITSIPSERMPQVTDAPSTAMAHPSQAAPDGAEVTAVAGENDQITIITVHPAPAEATAESKSGIRGILQSLQSLAPHYATKVENNARLTQNANNDIPISAAPTFNLQSSKKISRSYSWNAISNTVSMNNQEVYLGIHDDDFSNHQIVKASIGTSPNPLVKIQGATATLSVGGQPVTYKGHVFTLAPDGLKVGAQTFNMPAIMPAYPTDFAAVLTIDDREVTFVKDANNPTIMTANGVTATLGGPTLVMGGHQILYATDGALVLDQTVSIDPSPIGGRAPAGPAATGATSGGGDAGAPGRMPGDWKGKSPDGSSSDDNSSSGSNGTSGSSGHSGHGNGHSSASGGGTGDGPSDSSGSSGNSGNSSSPGGSSGSATKGANNGIVTAAGAKTSSTTAAKAGASQRTGGETYLAGMLLSAFAFMALISAL
ncbi:hypothetical protein BT63DRAFT_439085 [Microthyrium microscopicum]|uniref:Uncharacterized protein n=1 Tax=Microthyrium microscopicum TaxID=703497 RepID=A0A6A6UCE9_9PEZI|nr:hypothetical protein BT63DRAFT_439085 [Microthyrium microscopicum]